MYKVKHLCFDGTDEPVVDVVCAECEWGGNMRDCVVKFRIHEVGFEMGFCPKCHEQGKALLPLLIFYETRTTGKGSGEIICRIGSGEARF
jgi:hypothetical protein